MKRARFFLMAGCAAALLLQTVPVVRAENTEQPVTPEAREENTEQPVTPEAREEATEQLSAEDREIIEHMELLQNFELYEDENMELLLTLDVLTANE